MRKLTKDFRMIVSLLLIVAMAVTFMPLVSETAYAAAPVITTDKTEYQIGEDIMVTTHTNGASGGWVALYPASAREYMTSIYWYYPERFAETRAMFGGPDINVNDENWGNTEGVIDADKHLMPGEYQIVYATGAAQPYSIEGQPVRFTVLQGAPDENTFRLNKTKFNYSDPITVTANCDTAGCWIGLYGSDETPDSSLAPLFKFEVKDTEPFDLKSGTAAREFKPGSYKVILFGDSGYSNILQTANITVAEDPQPSDELTLSFDDPGKTVYKLGEPVTIRATGTAPGAWVGLYNADAKTDPNNGGEYSLRWYYVDQHNGEKVDILDTAFDDNNRGGLREGDYKVILFGDSGYTDEKVVLDFTLSGTIDIDVDSFSLEPSKTNFVSGEDITVTAKGTGIADGAWVGLYPAGSTSFGKFYLYKYGIKGKEGQEVVMQKQEKGSGGSTVPDGFYTLVLFADSGYNLPVLTKDISVTRATSYVKRLKEPGCRTLGLEYIVYEDGTDTYREIPTLGGHIWGDPVHVEGTAQHVYTCERNADHKKTEACRDTNEKIVKQAAVGNAGTIEYTCDKCGGTHEVAIPAVKTPSLAETEFVYTGQNIQPALNDIEDEAGDELDAEQYTVTYPAESKKVGTHTVKIEFKGKYTGTYSLSYKIIPKKTTLKSVKAGSKSFKATWKKGASPATGYQIAYSLNKSFSKCKYKKVKKLKTTSLTVKKLKKNKKYYVKVRTYKKVGLKYYYSEWSNVKTVKPKK